MNIIPPNEKVILMGHKNLGGMNISPCHEEISVEGSNSVAHMMRVRLDLRLFFQILNGREQDNREKQKS